MPKLNLTFRLTNFLDVAGLNFKIEE